MRSVFIANSYTVQQTRLTANVHINLNDLTWEV